MKGNANAIAKPSIPIAGATMLPDVETCTSKNPMIGPVQENETSVSVNAIKKILSSSLVLSALLSTFVLQDEGSVISNAPKNEAAKITSIRKNSILNMAFVDKAFNALAPKISVTASPKIR